jgi:uncharacterized membrane protein
MRSLIPSSLIAVAVLLAACSPEAPGGGEALPPADAPPAAAQAPGEPQPTTAIDPAAPFRRDFALRGTEPFWALDVKGTTLMLTRPDQPVLTAANARLAASSGKAIWTAQATGPAGEITVIATVSAGECSDGMSDRAYPYIAEVKVGEVLLKGCGISAEDLAKAPPA